MDAAVFVYDRLEYKSSLADLEHRNSEVCMCIYRFTMMEEVFVKLALEKSSFKLSIQEKRKKDG